ncbi:Rv3235 family protein [Thalassiella azotivora]
MTRTASTDTPPVRVLPVPVSEPEPLRMPTVERPWTPPAGQGVLALSFSSARQPDAELDPVFGPQPTSTEDLPDPEAFCTTLVRAVVEVLDGTRPVAQLTRWLASDVHAGITRRAALAARMRRREETRAARPAVVRAVRVCQPADGVVEGAAVVISRGRARAVAVRLEGMDHRWRATAVEVG